MRRNLKNKGLSFFIAILFSITWMPAFTEAKEPPLNEIVEISAKNIGESIIIDVKVHGFEMERVKIGEETYYKIIIGEEANILKKGEPDIPKICRSIIIPDDKKMGFRIIKSSYKEYEDMLVAPSKGNLPRTVDPESIPYVFGDVYKENGWYPGNLVNLREPYILRDFRGQVVEIYPIQYNPVEKKLRFYTHIIIEVFPVGKGEINVYNRKFQLETIDSNFKFIYEKHFINFYDVMQKYTPVEEEGNMLVICYDDFYQTMKPFVKWKNMKGIPTEIVNISEIGTTAADIKNYIVNYYNTYGLTFVLLVGDAQQIPTPLYEGYGASDPSYSYVVGNDHYPDLFVGRFSAQNISQLQTQVERTIEYEKYPQIADWYHRGIGIASNQGAGYGDDGEADWQHMRNIRSKLLNYTYTQVDEFYDGSHGGEDADGDPTATMVLNSLNEGRGLINYCGHGSATGWATSGFSISDIYDLTNDNMLPFIWSVACNNGEFNNYDECFAEAWLRATHNGEPIGAVAVFMSSISQYWAPPMDAQDEIIDILVESYEDNRKITFGGLSFNGCMHMNDEYGENGYDMTDTWHVFGDPSIVVRTDTPTSMNVQHSSIITVGATSFNVNVVGVEKALCAISRNGHLLGRAYTDENGEATIIFDEPIDEIGTLDLVVTAYNKIPYITTIEVVQPVRQPAEFEPMEGVLIRYPFGITYELIAEMAEEVKIYTIVASESEKEYVESQYESYGINLSNCEFLIAPTDTYWTRDYGPWFVFNDTTGEMEVINFTYNRPRPNDDKIPEAFANDQGMTLHFMDLVHTGGNYMTDGHGIAVSTELVWEENPDLTPEEINETVAKYLGIHTYHVVPDVLGEYIKHIDCWAKFLAPDKIMIIEVPPTHPQYDEIEAAVDYFESQYSCYGTPYKIYRVYTPNGEPYINSLILNDKVLVPITGSEWDDDAIAAYQAAMPGYEVLGFTAPPSHPWLTTDALHCRVKGIPDRYMLYIEHIPLKDTPPSDNGFLVEAKIIPYSGASLVNGTPVVYWKTEDGNWTALQMESKGNNTYYAYIPSQPCGETIYYYIHAEDASGREANHPYIGAADPHVFTVTPVPDIWVSPSSFEFVSNEGELLYDILTIGNDEFAGKNLTFNISCEGDGWLSFDIVNGSLQPGMLVNVTIIINTTGLDIGEYYETITIESNDPDETIVNIPVTLSIVYQNDVGIISINYPSGTIPPGNYTINATIKNFGTKDQTNVTVNCTVMEGILGTFLYEDFSAGVPPPGWSQEEAGEWQQSNTANAGGTAPEAYLPWDDVNGDYAYLDSIPVNTIGAPTLTLSFKHYIDHYTDSFNCRVYARASSTDSWHDVTPWNNPITGDIGPETVTIDITPYIGPETQIRFEFDGYYWNLNYWYIDDVEIYSSRDAGDVVYSSEVKVDVPAGSSKYVEFAPWNATYGSYAIRIEITTPDENESNNELIAAVYVKNATVDYIKITETPGGIEISNQTIYPGWSKIGYASAYNNTCGYIGLITVNWSVINMENATAYTSPLTGNSSTFYAGNSMGIAIWTADDGKGHNDTVYFEISMLTFNFTLFSGWNLITIPVENNLTAKSLLENITGCNIIYAWDSLNQTYKVYTSASPDEYNFVIEDGHAYFIGLSANTNFSVTGAPLTNVSVHLYPGWNLIGWFKEEPTTAKSLLENITGCNIIYAWDSLNQTYKVYTSASPDEYNFVIRQGDGVFVGVSEESIWHGEG